MNRTNHAGRAALVAALALCFAAPSFAQTSTTTPAPAATTTPTQRGAADNTNSKSGPAATMSFDSWASKHAADNQGKISRDAYLEEMGRRFDATDKAKHKDMTRQAYLDDLRKQWEGMDKSNAGLAPAEASRITGKVDVSHSAVPRTGSDAQAGNMGPTNVKK